MKLVSTLAVSAVLVMCAASAPAVAQDAKKSGKAGSAAAPAKGGAAEPAQSQRKYNLSKEARKAIGELQTAVGAKAADIPQKLAAAQAVAKNSDDRYVIAKLQLQHAFATSDKAGQRAAVDAILASGGADAAEQAMLNEYLAGESARSGDFTGMETTFAAKVQANPNDVAAIISLAQAKVGLKKDAEALALLERAITVTKANGGKAEESWYRNAVAIADRQNNIATASRLANEALSVYPNQDNFNNLIALTQPQIMKDREAHADLLRLLQVTDRIRSSTDYLQLARHHEYNRNWGEAKSVLEAAAKAGKTSPAHAALLSQVSARIAEDRAALPGAAAKARADATGKLALSLATVYAGYNDYATAADLYRVALQKGGVDANLANTRLGIALALGGQRADAEAAFRKVTGLRAPLANLWLAWLSLRG
jgi:hypothetical protein